MCVTPREYIAQSFFILSFIIFDFVLQLFICIVSLLDFKYLEEWDSWLIPPTSQTVLHRSQALRDARMALPLSLRRQQTMSCLVCKRNFCKWWLGESRELMFSRQNNIIIYYWEIPTIWNTSTHTLPHTHTQPPVWVKIKCRNLNVECSSPSVCDPPN